jgi:hypothetical protein
MCIFKPEGERRALMGHGIYVSKYHVENALVNALNDWNPGSAEEEVARALESMKLLAGYVRKVRKHAETVKHTIYKYVPYLHRDKNSATGKVEFYTGVHRIPMNVAATGDKTYCRSLETERHEGGETLKEAVEKVLALAAKFEVPKEGIETKRFEEAHSWMKPVRNPITGARPPKKGAHE